MCIGFSLDIPANTGHSPNAVSMLGQRQCTYFNFIIDNNIIVSQIHKIKDPPFNF